jgi:hypothetical protein
MSESRIYSVLDGDIDAVRLIEATSAAAAIRHVAAQRYRVSIAKPKDVAYHMAQGVKVEQAKRPIAEAVEAELRG